MNEKRKQPKDTQINAEETRSEMLKARNVEAATKWGRAEFMLSTHIAARKSKPNGTANT